MKTWLLTVAALLGSISAYAHDFKVDGIYYNITSDATVEVTFRGYYYNSYDNEYSGDIIIPSTVTYSGKEYSVTSIGDYTFYDCLGLTSVTIGNSVESIGDDAFWNCSGLTSVTIPNSVTSISSSAFSGCSGLTGINVEDDNETFDSRKGCNAIIHTSSNTLVSGCKTTIIPNTVTSIGDWAFGWCSDLTSVTIPNSVTSIGKGAFCNCSGLTSVTIPNSVTSIGDSAFGVCSGLTSVTIGNSVTSIGVGAFSSCSGLTSVTIPNSVTSIGNSAFSSCSGLTSVTIPNSVTSIGDWAFQYCSGLTSVTIGNSVTSIGEDAFYECSGLTSVHISDISAWCNIEFSNTISNPLLYAYHLYLNGEEVKDLVIPNSVTSIGDYAFCSCLGLTSVTIPNSVTSIGNSAFSSCSGLTSVTIPNSVMSIGQYAFGWCSGLLDVCCYAENVPTTEGNAFNYSNYSNATLHVPSCSLQSYKTTEPWSGFGTIKTLASFSGEVEIDGINYELNGETKQAIVIAKSSGLYSGEVVIPESVEHEGTTYSVTSIGEKAFYECDDLTSVTIPNSVTSIGESAFARCKGLTEIKVSEGNPVYDSREGCNAIIETASNTLLYGCKNTIIPNSVTSLGDYAFESCSGLTSVTIPNSVTSIGERAFFSCDGLTSVTIPNSVTSIGYAAFGGCDGLTEMKVDANNSKYDSREGCNAIIETSSNTLISGCLTTVIPNSVTSIGPFAFAYCYDLTSVTIPNSVESIGYAAFAYCWDLTSVTIPNSVTSIEYATFLGCSGLTSVTIGNSVTSIGKWAFYNCVGMQDVYCYAENVPSTESDAFYHFLPEYATLHVPAASIESYKTTYPWSGFGNIVALTKEYQLTVSSVGYATLYLDYNAEIPEGVEAYVATEVVDSRLKMQKVDGVLPANTGVIIVADQGTYTFTESDETPATIEKNLLQGSVANTFVTAEANTTYYVLSAPDGDVAMYRALITDGKFLNNAHKAYLPISNGDLGIFDDEVDSSVEQLSRRLVFDFGDETGIDEVKTENANVKTAVYDLSGRRIQNAQKGIYIQNGKLMVK